MHEQTKSQIFKKNLIYAFSAQGISLLLSALQVLITPKFLGTRGYSYFQLFIFYSTYVGIFHFGLIDGIYLRTGGKHYHKLNFPLLCTEFWYTMIAQIIIAGGITWVGFAFERDPEAKFVIYATAVNLVLTNAINFIGYVFQTTNHTKKFSIATMLSKLAFIVFIFLLIFTGRRYYQAFTVLYLVGQGISLTYSMIVGRRIIFSKLIKPSEAMKEMGVNISVGINLMLSNFASMLIIGSARLAVKARWSMVAFGKISLAVSLTNFFLLFISQVSMVLFPALKQTDKGNYKKYFHVIRDGIGALLPIIPLCYLPLSFLLGLWLPQYKISLEYLALLLPLCIFDGKMQLLCNTYLKALRKEKVILAINFMSVALSVILSCIGAFIIQSIIAIVIFISLSVAFRDVIAELYLSRLMHVSVLKNLAGEFALAALFSVLSLSTGKIEAFLIYLCAYLAFAFIWRKSIKSSFGTIRKVFGH